MTIARSRFPPTILATCCLPWNPDGTLAEATFRRSVRNLLEHLTRDIYLFGTAGEGYAVTDRQFDRILHIFREETNRPDARPMIGVISLSLGTILERIERAHDLGFRSFQISLPAWGELNERELFRFFDSVCGRFTDCSFLHYNLMRAKRLVSPDEYARLAAEFPNLVATKNGGGSAESVEKLITRAPHLVHFFTEVNYAYGTQVGPCGLLVSIASMNFARAREYFIAGRERDFAKLRQMRAQLKHLLQELIAVADAEAHMDGAYDQFYCKAHDPEFPLRLLPPYASFSEDKFRDFMKLVREKYPQWLP